MLDALADRLRDATTGGGDDDVSTDDSTTDSTTDASDGPAWTVADVPTEKPLNEVVSTAAGPFAVGAGGVGLLRSDGEWSLAVPDGPQARGYALTCAAATDDGERVWFAGSSGALGYYDVRTGRKSDYSAPREKTSTWEGIAVSGAAGSETLRIANGSGEVMAATTDEQGCPQWGDVVKPGSGSTIPAITASDDGFVAIDTSGNVFAETTEGWEDIGIRNAQVNFSDVYADADRLIVAGGGGTVFRYDRACQNWTPLNTAHVALRTVDFHDGRFAVAGANGTVVERTAAGWTPSTTATEATLRGIALGEIDVAVGAAGTVIER
ncbi:hypothetical protein [Halobaculum limi]|uniref:hypothetical protein n=1 Tax=Halobaculum limi TaxID=3031916 RepID=UPI0024056D45|nr:hypothetical protein [Halobaculum sp. YSMS11]